MQIKRFAPMVLAALMAFSPATAFADTADSAVGESGEAAQTIEAQVDPNKIEDTTDETAGTAAVNEDQVRDETNDGGVRGDVDSETDLDISVWTTEDFTYDYYEKLLYGCDYSRQFTVGGNVITGLSEQGEAKIKVNKDLVIPAKGPDGKNITGVGKNAFEKKGLTSVTFPTGMLIQYNDTNANTEEERVTRRGNFIICEGAFRDNELTDVTLPVGVIAVLPNAFQGNKIQKVKIPRTMWWIENCAFYGNEITRVDFPTTTDFQLELHGMPFAMNQLKSVRLPDFTEVVNKFAFAYNPGMEALPTKDPWGKSVRGSDDPNNGIVYMYTDNKDLVAKLQKRIHSIDGKNTNIYSPYQKLIVNGEAASDSDEQSWNAKDFTYSGGTVTGLSASGIAKRKVNKDLVIPAKSTSGKTITEIGSGEPGAIVGLFATEEEKFDSVYLPNSIVKVGDYAFLNSGLKDVSIPNKVDSIGVQAFARNNLTSVVLPDSVEELGIGAFSTNPKIEKIVLSSSLKEIPGGAFGCSDATNYMTKLTEIEIPDGVEKIGDNAFAGNNFHEIDIPSSVREIGRFAFSTKNYLLDPCKLTLHEGLQKIGKEAFRNKVIDEVVLPTTVQKLDKTTFRKEYTVGGHGQIGDKKTAVLISAETQYNDKTNFPNSDYHHVYLTDASVWTSEDFKYYTEDGGILIDGFSKYGVQKLLENTDVTLPAKTEDGRSITGVNEEAFDGANLPRKITGLTLPARENGTYSIGEYAFVDNDIVTLDIPEGVSEIQGEAFAHNKLRRITFPKTMRYIRAAAFEDNQLTDIVFPEEMDNPLEIETRAFGSNDIQAILLPFDTKVLAEDAFEDNTGKDESGVVKVYIPGATGSDIEDSDYQIVYDDPAAINATDLPWDARHFTYNSTGNVITGLSEAGQDKLRTNQNLMVPDRINGVTVTAIDAGEEGTGTFGFTYAGNRYTVKSVLLPSHLTSIGANAFDGNALQEISLPTTLQSLGDNAFRGNKLVRVDMPDSLTSLGSGAFEVANPMFATLETVTLSKGLAEIPASAFRNQKLTSLDVPSNVRSIADSAFRGNAIETLQLHDGLESIGAHAFEGVRVQTLDIPDSALDIGESAFASDASLRELVLGKKLETIAANAFAGSMLRDVALPRSVTTLSKDAFTGGTYMVEVRTSVEGQLKGESPYQNVAAKGTNHELRYDKLAGSGWDYSDFTYSEDGKTITGWSESGDQKRQDNHRVVLPDTASANSDVLITAIGDDAFRVDDAYVTIGKYDCTSPTGIQTVEFPKGLETIGDRAFEYNNLRNQDADGNLIDKPTEDSSELSLLADLTHLTYIGKSAFHGNHLCNVTIPDTVTSMGDGAFAMNNIYELKLSKNMDIIPSGAFSMNIRMSHVDIPDNVTEIGQMAFAGARLTSLEIPASVRKIGRKAFHLHQMKALTIPGTVKELGDSAFEGTYKAAKMENLVIEEGVEVIGDRAFKEGHLSMVVLPSSVKSIGSNVFENNTGHEQMPNNEVVVLTDNAELLQCNDRHENYVVYLRDIAKNGTLVTGIANKTYTGKSLTQNLTVKLGTVTLKSGTDYTVSYTSNKNVGVAKVVITGKGKFSGKITKTFTIYPKGTSVKKLKKGKKSFTAVWGKQSKQVTGYQLQYSTSKKMKKAKSPKIKSYRTTKKTIKKLKAKKTYYVRIRTYKKVGAKIYYSSWSKIKAVKTK